MKGNHQRRRRSVGGRVLLRSREKLCVRDCQRGKVYQQGSAEARKMGCTQMVDNCEKRARASFVGIADGYGSVRNGLRTTGGHPLSGSVTMSRKGREGERARHALNIEFDCLFSFPTINSYEPLCNASVENTIRSPRHCPHALPGAE